MTPRSPIPGDIYDAAMRYYIRESGDADATLLRQWAEWRYGNKYPDAPADIAFWALSEAACFGVARVVVS